MWATHKGRSSRTLRTAFPWVRLARSGPGLRFAGRFLMRVWARCPPHRGDPGMARRFAWALLAVVAMTATGRAATVRTANFVVETARQDDADEFARLAEYYRKQKALDWLGYEMPRWKEPCRLRVTVTGNGAGGATTFDFNGREVVQGMQIGGARERLKTSVLPHEAPHPVFPPHFRQPVPRWADEGGS